MRMEVSFETSDGSQFFDGERERESERVKEGERERDCLDRIFL